MTDIVQMNMQEMDGAKSSSQVSLGSQNPSPNGRAKVGKKKSSSLPNETVEYLKAWMMAPEHIAHPYPTEQEKMQIMAVTGVEMKQLTNWFVNNRKRYWKPRVEARLQQHAHVAAAAAHTHVAAVVAESAIAIVNPVSPDPLNRQTVNVHQPSNGFVPFDLCPSPMLKKPLQKPQSLSVVRSDFSRVLHVISESSSSASVSSSEGDCSESSPEEFYASDASRGYDATTGMVTNSEVVDVHILRPLSGKAATLEDVTVLSSVPVERIVTTFNNCAVTFVYPKSERKKMQTRRDAEIVRVKKQCLTQYNDAQNNLSLPIQKRKLRQAQFEQFEEMSHTPRKKFRRVSLEVWKTACQNSANVYCDSLPTLEEAVQLFGYAS